MVDADHSARAAARQFGVSDSFAIKLMARRKMTGDIKPARQGRPEGTGKLAPYRSYLLAPVQGQPDISLAELCPRLEAGHGIKTYTGPIWADVDIFTQGWIAIKNSVRHKVLNQTRLLPPT